jgi:hypothetical protein
MKSTLLIATIVAAALVSTGALPAFAAKNDGGFSQSSEGNKTSDACTLYLNHYSQYAAKMKTAKSKDARNTARDEVNWAIEKGFGLGCAWVDGV